MFCEKTGLMKEAKDLLPWKVTDISLHPYEGFWSFNPSIHFDGETWRCVLRCCDYAMPGGITVRSKHAGPMGQQTKNAMVLFDPQTWKPLQVFKMHEKDGLPRESCPHVGYEDMRIFKTDKGGLQGIAASLHLRRGRPRTTEGVPQHQPPEQVLLSFDASYNIVGARPIRGNGSGTPQKNWVPFDHCTEPRFLYSIDKGVMFDDCGALHGDDAKASPSSIARSSLRAGPVHPEAPPSSESPRETSSSSKRVDHRVNMRGSDIRILRGGRRALDAASTRPSSRPPGKTTGRSIAGASAGVLARSANDSMRVMGSGRIRLPKYQGLRGGTQLCRIGEGAWLGIGHEMKFVGGKKYYWHAWYVVDDRGKMTFASEPMKLAPNGIEFAAGLAVDGDRVVVSFGVDDMESKLGETSLSAVLGILSAIE